MSDRTNLQRKKGNTSTIANPSLVSSSTPTLANPSQNLSSSVNTVVADAAVRSISRQQDPQSTNELSPEAEAFNQEPLAHDLSRISLRSQSSMSGRSGDPLEPGMNWSIDRVMRMSEPGDFAAQMPEIRFGGHDLSRMSIESKDRVEPSSAAISPSIQRKCAACDEDEEQPIQKKESPIVQRQVDPIAMSEIHRTPDLQREPDKMPPKKGTTTINKQNTTITASGKTITEAITNLTSQGKGEAGSVTCKPEKSVQTYQADEKSDPIVYEANVVVTETKAMPVWTELDRQCEPVKKEWNRFYQALDTHENGHISIDEKAFTNSHRKLLGKSESAADTVFDEIYKKANTDNDAYDSRTQHGLTQGTGVNPVQCGLEKVGSNTSSVEDEAGTSDIPSDYPTTVMAKRMSPAPAEDRSRGHDLSRISIYRNQQQTSSFESSVPELIGQHIQAASGGGSKLDEGLQQHLEHHLGADLSGVNIHTDGEADRLSRSVNAIAFTAGQDIFFSSGSYNPNSSEGKHLIAHEVVHTVQQANGAVSENTVGNGISISDPSDAFEQEAERLAGQVMSMPDTATQQPIKREIPEEDKIHTKRSLQRPPDVDLPAGSNFESRSSSNRSEESLLSDEASTFMEPRFGADFRQVRVHIGNEAVQMKQELNAQAFAHRQDIYFGPGKSPANDALTAHELTHVMQQNSLQTKLINKKLDLKIPNANQLNNNYIQLEPTPTASKDSISAAIASRDQAAISSFVPKQLGKATTEQKMAMIDILLEKGNFFEKAKVPAIWDSFGKDIETVANAHNELWGRSFKVAGDHMRTSKEVIGLQKVFNLDVEDVASSYLNQNELYCKSELKRLGLTETGEVIVGPPTEEQSTHLKATQADAAKLLVDQDALRDLCNVMCGYQRTLVKPGSEGGTDVKPEFLDEKVAFDPDPEKQPTLEPKPGDGMKSWKEVKETYDNLKSLIEARISTNPSLFPLLRGSYEDTSKTAKVAQGSREDALSILGGELHGVLMNIQKTRPMLTTLASELQPIHQQLLSGAVANPAAKSRNWKKNPFFAVLGQDITEQLKPGPWWQTIGVAAAELAGWVVAGMATGGVAIGVGMAANSAAQVALNEGKRQALTTASQTNVTASTALISDGQVKEAEAEVIVSAAFALLDTVLAVGAVRGALRKVFQFEQEAAKSAKRAAELADKAMLTAGEEAQQAAKEARQLANEAKISAEKARATASTATPEEIARAEHKALKAEENAAKAERSALDAEASAGVFGKDIKTHAEPRTVGEHKISVRGNRVVRCSPEPCAELIHSVAERSERLISELSKSTELGSRAEELGSRLRASKQRAEALAERARTELGSTTDRLKAETKFLEEGAFIEKDVQAIEQQIALEIQQSKGTLGSNWGNMVKQNVAERTRVTKERATVGGNLSKDLEKRLNNLENRAEKLSKDAAEFDKPKHLRKGGVSENDISLKWKELDKDIEGLEREERVRRDVRELGGKSLGESDAEMRKNLEIPSNKDGTPGKSPDIGYDMGGGTLLLSESKGADIDGALGQFASAMSGDKAKSFKNFDLRIYMNSTAFEKLVNGLNE